MASIGNFAQSYITNLYDKQQKNKKNASRLGGGGGGRPPPPSVVTPLNVRNAKSLESFKSGLKTHDICSRRISIKFPSAPLNR